MDKRRQPLVTFRWSVDQAGYDLSPDRQQIVRRGGAMKEYDPAQLDPPPHRVFAELYHQVYPRAYPARIEQGGLVDLIDSARDEPLTNNPNAPVHRRRFRSIESALLGFVQQYGFLGTDRTGADAEYEDVKYLLSRQSDLYKVIISCLTSEELTAPVYGPTLRMCLGKGLGGDKMEIHYEPETLHAWMWLRTADDQASGVDWSGAPCLYCFRPIGRGPGGHRKDAGYCSGRCRTYFNRLPTVEQAARIARAETERRNQGARV